MKCITSLTSWQENFCKGHNHNWLQDLTTSPIVLTRNQAYPNTIANPRQQFGRTAVR